MIRFLTILTILAFSASQGFATPLDLVVTGGDMTTRVSESVTVSDTVAAAMPLSTDSTTTVGSSSSFATATYEFTNAAGVAIFDIQPTSQSVVWDGAVSFGLATSVSGDIDFQLNEAADYSVTGDNSGTSSTTGALNSTWQLFDVDDSLFVFRESENSAVPANHIVNGLQDSSGGFDLIGSPTGTLPPGNYRFIYNLSLEVNSFSNVIVDANGFANLTLTSLIPEPASAVLMLMMLGAAAYSRRARRP